MFYTFSDPALLFGTGVYFFPIFPTILFWCGMSHYWITDNKIFFPALQALANRHQTELEFTIAFFFYNTPVIITPRGPRFFVYSTQRATFDASQK